MNKLTDLLKQMGATPELVSEFTSSLDRHEKELRSSIRSEFEKAYTVKEARAKEICVEHVEKEKVRLSRRVQVFLESKQREIEEAAQRQRSIEESEATQVIRRVKALLEGNNPNAVGGDIRDLQTSREVNARLEKVLASIKEERDAAIRSAARARKIAEDVLDSNKKLEASVRALYEAKKAKACPPGSEDEDCDDGDKKPKSKPESKGKWQKPWEKKKTASEGVMPQRRQIDESRKVAANAQSTRTVTEAKNQSVSNDIASIAANLGE